MNIASLDREIAGIKRNACRRFSLKDHITGVYSLLKSVQIYGII